MTNEERTVLQDKIVDTVLPKDSGRLLLAPRVGKTRIAVSIIKRDKPKSILWVTPFTSLATKDVPEEFEIWGAKEYLKVLEAITWRSLHKITGHYDLIVLDEEQYITVKNSKNLRDGTLSGRIITMTGTPTQHFDKIQIYRKLKLESLYKIDINAAVDMGLLSNYTINVVKIPLSRVHNIRTGSKTKRFLTSEEKFYDFLDKSASKAIEKRSKFSGFQIRKRKNFIKKCPSKIQAAVNLIAHLEGRKLIFAANIQQSQDLCEYTYNSKTDDVDLEKFKSGEIDTIAMVQAGGVGHTYKGIDHLILVQADADRNGSTSQRLARTLLRQDGYKATIWILCMVNTRDEDWIKSTLENFDEDKIFYKTIQEVRKELTKN